MNGQAQPVVQAPGFEDVVFDSQRVFRSVLGALSFPGRAHTLATTLEPPGTLNLATTAACLALVDLETPVWLDGSAGSDAARSYLRFHCGCPLVDHPHEAAYAVITDPAAMPSLREFDHGDDRYPDRSATLIVQVSSLEGEAGVTLTGPGIDEKSARSSEAWAAHSGRNGGRTRPPIRPVSTCFSPAGPRS